MSEEKDKGVVTESPKMVVTQAPDTETKAPETSTNDVEVVPIDPETEKRGGVKESMVNNDGVAVEKSKIEASSEEAAEPDAKPSFFVKKTDKHRVEVDVLTSKRDGRIMSVSRSGLGLNFAKDFAFLRHDMLWFEFSIPNYEDMSTYRQRSASWRRDAQQVVVDKLQLRNFLLVWHLKDWSVPDENGNKVVLKFEENGTLADESMAQVYALMPTLLDIVLTVFEKDVLIT